MKEKVVNSSMIGSAAETASKGSPSDACRASEACRPVVKISVLKHASTSLSLFNDTSSSCRPPANALVRQRKIEMHYESVKGYNLEVNICHVISNPICQSLHGLHL